MNDIDGRTIEIGDYVRITGVVESPLMPENMMLDDYREAGFIGKVIGVEDADLSISVKFPHDTFDFSSHELELIDPRTLSSDKPVEDTDLELVEAERSTLDHTPDARLAALVEANARLAARVKALEDALSPFAELASVAMDTLPAHSRPEYIWYQFNDVRITVGHLHTAFEARQRRRS